MARKPSTDRPAQRPDSKPEPVRDATTVPARPPLPKTPLGKLPKR